MAVYNGASGMCDFSVLTIITDELLAKERAATEEAAAAARAQVLFYFCDLALFYAK